MDLLEKILPSLKPKRAIPWSGLVGMLLLFGAFFTDARNDVGSQAGATLMVATGVLFIVLGLLSESRRH
jgi:hypothetical protein